MSKLMMEFRRNLEEALDEGFPKIEEEGPAKEANKRGPALAIFAEAVMQAHKIVAAFGGCEDCFGKGYATQQLADGVKVNYCRCERGQQLELVVANMNV